MKPSTTYLIGIVLTIGIGGILQYFLCCGGETVAGSSTMEESIPVAGMPFALEDPGSEFAIYSAENFDFPLSSYSYLQPLSTSLENSISELGAFLNSNGELSLDITGYHYAEEDNLSAFPTLGEARANAVKSALIERGFSASQLSVRGSELEGSWADGDSIVHGPVSYRLTGPDDMTSEAGNSTDRSDAGADSEESVAEDFTEFVRNLKDNPMILHFETGSAYVNLTPAERQTISRLNQYIDQNDQARIIIEGHTDNSGTNEVNERLGSERAEFLKSYLVRNGFRPDRIQTISHGQSQPVASNNTEAGRAENRRAVLTIQN